MSRINSSTSGCTADSRNATSYYVRTVINNHSLLALLDSGCDANILPVRYAERVNLRPTNKTLLVANGSKMDVVGECVLTVRIANRLPIRLNFIVSETAADVMLGSGFLNNHDIMIHFGRGILYYGRRRINLTKKRGAQWARRIQVVEPVTLQPLSQSIIPSKILIVIQQV